MPLPTPVARRLIQRRTIVCQGFERADGGFDMDSSIADVKTTAQVFGDRNVPAGEPMHGMALRLTIDEALTIKDTQVALDHTPYGICAAIAPSFSALNGQSIVKGFTRAVRSLFGGIHGCVHVVSLLGPTATTAIQATSRRRWSGTRDPARKPWVLDSCHTWASDSPIVKREYPQFYTGK